MIAAGLISMASMLLWLALAVPVLVILLRMHNRTRLRSLLWLAAALVVWPFWARLLTLALPLWLRHLASVGAPLALRAQAMSLLYLFESLIGGVLVLLAVVCLHRELLARVRPAPPPVVASPYGR